MRKIIFPLRYEHFRNGISENVGSIYNADNKAIASFVNKPNAKKIIEALELLLKKNQ